MGGSSREPWIKLKLGFRRSDKLAALPTDSARLGWVYALLEAKAQRRSGVFANRHHLVDVLGRFGEYFDDYQRVGLVEIDPDLCADCAKVYVDLKPGEIAVHDFLREQRDPTTAERQAAWREREGMSAGAIRTAKWRLRQAVLARDAYTCRYCGRDDYDRDWLIAEHVDPHGPDDLENLVTACRSCNKLKGERTPEEAGMPVLPVGTVTRHGDGSHSGGDASRPAEPEPPPAPPTASQRHGDASPSRARGTTVTATATVTDEKKNVSDGVVEGSNGVSPREAVEAPFLSDPNRAGRRSASPGPAARPAFTVPPAIDAATPKWRTPCVDYVSHQREHRIIDGQAVCPPCEERLAEPVKPNGADHGATDPLGL